MANPFLFDADYGGGAATTADISMTSSAAAAAANPFLSDFGGGDVSATMPDFGAGAAAVAPVTEVNPFLSYQPAAEATYTTMSHDVVMATGGGGGSSGGGNPFASFLDASMDTTPAPVQPMHMGGATSTGAAVFGTEPVAIDQGKSLFGGAEVAPTVAVENLLDIQEEPSRPPPASVPSSTKDLLETVTGALEATSDSLLDRLRATQPSPVPQVIQPSPSPRSPSPDLMMGLMGDDPPPPPPPSANPLAPSPGLNQLDSIMDMFDAPISTGPKSSQEILGLYNSSTTTAAPSTKPEPLLDLLDSIPPAANDTTISSEPPAVQPVETVEHKMEVEQPAPPPPTQDQQIETIEAIETEAVSNDTTKFVEEEPVIEPAKPQPMRPPPPAPAPKSAPPERPKPPPPAQAPVIQPQPQVVAAVPPPVPEQPSPQQTVQPETRSPLPSRPPPPVPPAPRVSPQPQQQIPEPMQQIKSPSPPASHTTTPSPTRAPPVPPQPVSAAPVPAPPVPQAPPSAPSIFDQPTTITSNSITNSSPFGSSNISSSSPFGATMEYSTTGGRDAFSSSSPVPAAAPPPTKQAPAFAAATAGMGDSFDAFEAKFSRAGNTPGDAFGDAFGSSITATETSGVDSAWGSSGGGFGASDSSSGFGNDGGFDSFLTLTEPPPVPQSTPAKHSQAGDDDDDFDEVEKDMSIVIKPKSDKSDFSLSLAPALAPPPKSPAMSTGSAFSDENTAYVPFLSSAKDSQKPGSREPPTGTTMHRSDSQDSPQTPLYEEDQSQPLEDFPRINYVGEGWDMFMRLPNKKKITGQRFWKKCFVKVGYQNDVPVVQIYNAKGEKDPFQEIPLQPCYSVSEISAQQFDQYGKVFTLKIQYIFYKERPGVRPGQLSKASRISDKLSQFAAYAIQGDYSGVKEFGSDLKKLGAPIEHAPQVSQLVKLGVHAFEDIKVFSIWIEENLFKMSVHRDRAINYKTEEIQVSIVDEYYVEQDIYGVVTRQIARVRLFFLSFLNGVAEVEMGVNDLRRQGKEIVGRHDIIPVPTEEWIRMEAIEFSNCVQLDEFENTQTIKFKPPDACYIELMRFRVRPPRHRELPLQVKTVFTIVGQRVEIRSDILVPGFTSRKLGQIPCEDVMVRFPIPEEWIYMFRVEKHFRYGSVKSAHRRSGKVKGIERLLGAVEAVENSLMETTSGQAKYEHHHKAIVWRIPRLPKEGQGAYTTHSFFCHITLQSHERVPENLSKYCYIEFTMPHTTVSHTVCRSISVPSCDDPPEKACRYLSRHEYICEIEHSEGFQQATYTVAAATTKKEEPPPPPEEEKPMPGKAESDSDFSDDD